MFLDLGDERAGIDGFGDVIGEAVPEKTFAIAGIRECGDREDLQLLSVGKSADEREHFFSVHTGEHDVAQYQGGLIFPHPFTGGFTRIERCYVETCLAENYRQQLDDRSDILDDNDRIRQLVHVHYDASVVDEVIAQLQGMLKSMV